MKNKFGHFSIDAEIIDDHADVVLSVMGKVIVLRAEHYLTTKVIQYTALCADFDEVEAGEQIPTYEVQFDSDTFAVTWVKVAA